MLNIKKLFYSFLIVLYPFSVLFCPRLNIGFTHARIDELLVFIWAPIALVSFLFSKIKRITIVYYLVFLSLSILFTFGVLYAGSSTGWSIPNLKNVSRPVFFLMNLIVLRYWIYKGKVKIKTVLLSLVASITIAGVIGLYATTNPTFAYWLTNTYASGIFDMEAPYRFNMSFRAMSVFSGYDQASITYAIGVILSLFIVLNYWRRKALRYLCILMIILLTMSIISSARVGIIALMGGLIVFFSFTISKKITIFYIFSTALAILILGTFILPFARDVIPTYSTNRLMELTEVFNFKSHYSILERVQGFNALYYTQVRYVNYPRGWNIILGYGDDGKFISDVGYINVFCRYGLLGIFVLISSFVALFKTGSKIGKLIESVQTSSKYTPVNFILPALIVLFAIGSMKGGLYFLTFKTGECFALIIALCIVEAEEGYKRLKILNVSGNTK